MANNFWTERHLQPRRRPCTVDRSAGPQTQFVLTPLDTHVERNASELAENKQKWRHPLDTLQRKPPTGFLARVFLIFLALAVGARAQQNSPQPLTVERIYSSPSLSGSLTQGIEWAPDSKRISYLDRGPGGSNELWTMDASTGERKVFVKAETLAAVMQPEKGRAVQSTGLGRVEPDQYLWSPDGSSLLFIGSTTLVSLDLQDDSEDSRQRRGRS